MNPIEMQMLWNRFSTYLPCLLAILLSAHAVQPKTLYDFDQATGYDSAGQFVAMPHGTLYGTAASGGISGGGIAFKFNVNNGAFTVLHNFGNGTDGAQPAPAMTLGADGLLYGAAEIGGTSNQGIIFCLNPRTGGERIVHNFAGGSDGGLPTSAPVFGADGMLYGTTGSDGAYKDGVIYKIDPKTDAETIVYNFTNVSGISPAALTESDGGVFYGTTKAGGSNNDTGVIFAFDPSTSIETVLYSFTAPQEEPSQRLAIDQSGVLYGVVQQNEYDSQIFKFDPASRTLTVLYTFPNVEDLPHGPLVFDTAGNLYGAVQGDLGSYVFKLVPSTGVLTKLFTFNGKGKGGDAAGVVFGKGGRLYGATSSGGSTYKSHKYPGYGTLFSIAP